MQQKIEKGEDVDLEKLLPKEKGMHLYNDFEKMEWVSSDAGMYLVPAKKPNRINSFRCWDQVFRIYATIYCGVNPARAKEVWQYISVINTATSVYIWDNVYHYDIVFRQLMEFNPNCSWAITYNHILKSFHERPAPTKRYKFQR